MTLIVHNVKLPLGSTEEDLPRHVGKFLGMAPRSLHKIVVQRRSLDCRKGRPPHWVYAVLVDLDHETSERLVEKGKARRWDPQPVEVPFREQIPRPVVVGTGPAGLFCAWRLVQGGASPRILERGPEVVERSKRWHRFVEGGDFDPECHLLYGEGGAGTYSDGKLYTRVQDPRVPEVLEALVEFGAPEEILIDARPHVGSNLLPSIVKRMRLALEAQGAEFFFEHRLTDLIVEENENSRTISKVVIETNGEQYNWNAEALFLAAGHSARDVYRMLAKHRVPMSPKPFQIGVRVEHPQITIDQMQYGESAGHPQLPPADYSLVSSGSGQDVYSFCMCPGGEILPSTERAGYLCVNGASRYQRKSPWANSGFVITLEPESFEDDADPLAGIALQERIERAAFEAAGGDFSAPALRLRDFLDGSISTDLPDSSYPRNLTPTSFEKIFPAQILDPIRAGLSDLVSRFPEFGDADALVTAPESRSSSPVRIDRNPDTYESQGIERLFPLGEGAGFAGGILSAALDGMKAAEVWLSRCSSLDQSKQ
ncbi:MAG: FAD-binding protein [Planctomycetota bacterium]|nr:FAD-binding protein [Planctomycetota bacterium]